jgi:hypothetical protein
MNPKHSTRNLKPSTLNPQPSTLNPQPSTLNPQLSTLNSQPSTLNPQPSTLNSQVYAKTGDPASRDGLSLFLVEKGNEGFRLGQQIKDKCGMRASMTAELVFVS